MDTKKMRECSSLLPDPGGEVVRKCLDEIERLTAHILELENELAAGVHTCGPTCRKTPRCAELADLHEENARLRAELTHERFLREQAEARETGRDDGRAIVRAEVLRELLEWEAHYMQQARGGDQSGRSDARADAAREIHDNLRSSWETRELVANSKPVNDQVKP